MRRILAALLVLAGLAGVVGAQSDWSASPEVRDLYNKAKAEGQVVIWGPAVQEMDWLQAEFGRRFPGIEVKWTEDLSAPTKLIAEYRAGRHAVDVFVFSLGGLMPVNDRGILGPNDWAVWGTPAGNVFFNGNAAATHNLVYTVVYNTEHVKESDLPKRWDDLLDPRWKNRLVASEFLLPRLLGFLALEWGEAKTAEFARALRDRQNLLVTRAPIDGVLRSGERVASVGNFRSNALIWRTQGAPTGWVPLSPTGAVQFAVSPLSRAPHPHAAKLLAGWMTTDEAKNARERLRFDTDVRPGARTRLALELKTHGMKLLYEDVGTMKQRADFYNRLAPIVTGQAR
jgi:ABC-type Fe3+ transport system substrate-binding protein